jgi:PAS domain S-box-containing protein
MSVSENSTWLPKDFKMAKFREKRSPCPVLLEELTVDSIVVEGHLEPRHSAGKLIQVLESIEDGYYEVDLAGNFTFFNSAMCRILGYDAHEMAGMNYRHYMDAENAQIVFDTFNRVYRTGVSEKAFNWQLLCNDGSCRNVATSVSMKYSDDGSPIGFMGIARDITNVKMTECALRESENRYRAFLDFSADPIVIYDMHGRATYVNPAFEQTFGWTAEELLGSRIDFVPEAYRVQTETAIAKLVQGEAVNLMETRRLTKSGQLLDVQLSAAVYRDSGGKPSGIIVILRNVSALKEAENALEKSRHKFQILVEESPYGIAIIDRKGNYRYLNPKFTELFGYTLSDIPHGRQWFQSAFPDETLREEALGIWKKEHERWRPGESRPYTFEVACKNGRKRTVNFRPVILPNSDFFVSYEDVTDRVKAEEKLRLAHLELKKAHEELQALDRAKEKVINHLSHELKTPLAVLGAVFKILSRELHRSNNRRFNNVIERGKRNCDRLKATQDQIEDILRFGAAPGENGLDKLIEDLINIKMSLVEKSESSVFGHLIEKVEAIYRAQEVCMEPIDISRMLEEICAQAAGQIDRRNIRLIRKISDKLLVELDRNILQKVFSGLLRNAIENTPDEGIIQVQGQADEEGVRVEFTDHGIGISPEDQHHIFSGFFHTQETKNYASRKAYDFDAGGSGSDLMRMKVFSERFGFSLTCRSRLCRFIDDGANRCPGRVSA